ncbi:MerR family transcriptional regulator [Streptosporangium sp. CA-115845]|uniref:MerR family transcriptional regulator n=1 Tax=Streptosporangium sp. CA-115845 TaxID=3240071 RepID=UPI003D9424CA
MWTRRCLAQVVAAHAEALDVQIRTLHLRRAVLTAVARRGSTLEEMDLMHKLAKLSEHERRTLIDDFFDTVFGGLDVDHAFAGIRRSMTPELPDNPEPEQVEAWVELADLFQDLGFRTSMRHMAEDHAAERGQGADTVVRRDLAAIVRDQVAPAAADGMDPASGEAAHLLAALTARYADLIDHPDNLELRHLMLTRLKRMNDPRRERYLTLLAAINGRPAPEMVTPALEWCLRTMRAQERR